MSSTKKIGRPKRYRRDDALQKAINVFWKRGYEGASMKRLTAAMGINSPSLYAEFGDKHGLYLNAITSYASNDACAPLVAFETEPDLRRAVHAFFDAAISYSTANSSGASGCFLASCVATSAGHVEGTAEMLRAAIEATDKRIAARFQLEIGRGALPETFPASAQAKLMFDLRQGLVFRARAGISAETLREDIERNVEAVLAPASACAP